MRFPGQLQKPLGKNVALNLAGAAQYRLGTPDEHVPHQFIELWIDTCIDAKRIGGQVGQVAIGLGGNQFEHRELR